MKILGCLYQTLEVKTELWINESDSQLGAQVATAALPRETGARAVFFPFWLVSRKLRPCTSPQRSYPVHDLHWRSKCGDRGADVGQLDRCCTAATRTEASTRVLSLPVETWSGPLSAVAPWFMRLSHPSWPVAPKNDSDTPPTSANVLTLCQCAICQDHKEPGCHRASCFHFSTRSTLPLRQQHRHA